MARKKSSHIEEKVNSNEILHHPSTEHLTALGFMFFHNFLYHGGENTEKGITSWSYSAEYADKKSKKFGSATIALAILLNFAQERIALQEKYLQ